MVWACWVVLLARIELATRLYQSRVIPFYYRSKNVVSPEPISGHSRDAPVSMSSVWHLHLYKNGAGKETRTLDIFLGKEVLYQLSYTRILIGAP